MGGGYGSGEEAGVKRRATDGGKCSYSSFSFNFHEYVPSIIINFIPATISQRVSIHPTSL